MKDDDILCELHADIVSGASDDCEIDKILGTHNFDGKGQKEQYKWLLANWPHNCLTYFSSAWTYLSSLAC